MPLSFPLYFPSEFLSSVVAAEAEAETLFRSATGSQERRVNREVVVRVAAASYFTSVALCFARQACAAARAGQWPVHEIAEVVAEFARRLGVHTEYELLRPIGYGWLTDEIRAELLRSSGWLEHLKERAEVARRQQVGGESEVQPGEGLPTLTAVESVPGAEPEPACETPSAETTRRQQVDEFLERCNHVPGVNVKLIRTHIWKAAQYRSSRSFEQWQSGSRTETLKAGDSFARILAMSPTAFVGLLRKKGIL